MDWRLRFYRIGKLFVALIVVTMAFTAVLAAPTLNMLKAKTAKAADSEKPPIVVVPAGSADPLALPPTIPDAKRFAL